MDEIIKMRMTRPGIFYIIYKTVHQTTGEYYVGRHHQRGFEFDGYLGSGTKIRESVIENGKGTFKRETLHAFFNEVESVDMEKKIVCEALLNEPLCLNMRLGSAGGTSPSGGINNIRGASITDEEIQEIIKLCNSGMTQTDIAKRFGVAGSTIQNYLQKFGVQIRKQKEK